MISNQAIFQDINKRVIEILTNPQLLDKEQKFEEIFFKNYDTDILFHINNETAIEKIVIHAAAITFFMGTVIIDVEYPFIKIINRIDEKIVGAK